MAVIKKWLSWIWPQAVSVSEGEISPVLEVSFENGKKVLNAGRVNYSFGALHEVFRIAFYRANIRERDPENVLILGFGAGSIASILLEEYGLRPNITGIEADAEVIRIAKQEFSITRFAVLKLVHAKAEDFVFETSEKYDLIAIDVFVEDLVPEIIRSEKFIARLPEILSEKGCVVMNQMQRQFHREDAMLGLFRKYFSKANVQEIRMGEIPNGIIIAEK